MNVVWVRKVALGLVVLALFVALPVGAASASDGEDKGSSDHSIPSYGVQGYTTRDSNPGAPDSEGSNAPRWPWDNDTDCEHKGKSDHLHYSTNNTTNETEVSVHGWWKALNDQCPPKAKVWVALQAWRCSGWWIFWDCYWDTVSQSRPEKVYSGGGSGNRVNARHRCASFSPVSWRVVVDVDIPDENDSADKWYAEYRVRCNPRD